MSPGGIPSKQNSVDTEFHQHRIPSTWSSVATEFRRQRNSVDTEFACRHGILPSTWNSPSTRNSPVDTEFRRHVTPSTWNSVDTEFCQHGILHIFYFPIFSMLCYAIHFCPNSDGIPYTKIHRIP
jgi:hypothetical protein